MLRWQALYFSITKKMMENYVIYLETASIWHNVNIISAEEFFFYMVIMVTYITHKLLHICRKGKQLTSI